MRARAIRVLHSMPAPDGEVTRYADHMQDGAAEDVAPRFFSWRAALRADIDVFHVHWPEYLLRASSGGARLAKAALYATMLVRLRSRRIPIVWTLHNTEAHESGRRLERALVRATARQAAAFIQLNPASPPPTQRSAHLIPHGHYRDRFASHERKAPEPGRILYFGLIRPYKNVEHLIRTFADVPGGDWSLRIVGKPKDAGLEAAIVDAAAGDERVSLRLAFVPDAELVDEVSRAEAVVLPYQEMHNSGSAIVALSLDRPIIVPSSSVNEWLADEVGREWVLTYDGELDARRLEALVRRARGASRPPRVDLSARDWHTVGARHAEVYRSVLDSRRG